MSTSRRRVALRELLDLCDELQSIRARLNDVELPRDSRNRLRRKVRTTGDRLARELSRYRFRGPLAELIREFEFDLVHFQILATLLQRHLRSEDPAIEGRRLLASLFDSSFDVLSGAELLHENGALRSSGVVVVDGDEDAGDDVLDTRVRLSEDALAAFRDEIAGLVVEHQQRAPDGYESNQDYLLDLRVLHNLYKHRSERLFHQDRWDRVRTSSVNAGRRLSRRIESFRGRIQRRLAASHNAEEFPTIRFATEHHLTEEELMAVVHMLFKELYEGNAYADVADLIRLVSASESELLTHRGLFAGSSRLVKHEIVHIEAMIDSRELTGEAYLADWVVNFLFGGRRQDTRIEPDDRLDWHVYLKNLEDTGSFFRDLEAN